MMRWSPEQIVALRLTENVLPEMLIGLLNGLPQYVSAYGGRLDPTARDWDRIVDNRDPMCNPIFLAAFNTWRVRFHVEDNEPSKDRWITRAALHTLWKWSDRLRDVRNAGDSAWILSRFRVDFPKYHHGLLDNGYPDSIDSDCPIDNEDPDSIDSDYLYYPVSAEQFRIEAERAVGKKWEVRGLRIHGKGKEAKTRPTSLDILERNPNRLWVYKRRIKPQASEVEGLGRDRGEGVASHYIWWIRVRLGGESVTEVWAGLDKKDASTVSKAVSKIDSIIGRSSVIE